MNTEVALAITDGLVSDRESLKEWMTRIGLEITRITKNQISVKNPNNPEGKPIPLRGEFYEQNFRHSEQSEDLKRAASERYRQEADSRYANSIERYGKLCESKSRYHLERFGTRDRTDSEKLTRQLTGQENEHTSEYKYNGENLSKDTKALQESLKAQIKSMNADLQTLSGLSQATAEQAKLKKALFSSNIVLALIALTLLISSICLGYVSKSKYSDITAMENKVEYLKSEGGV